MISFQVHYPTRSSVPCMGLSDHVFMALVDTLLLQIQNEGGDGTSRDWSDPSPPGNTEQSQTLPDGGRPEGPPLWVSLSQPVSTFNSAVAAFSGVVSKLYNNISVEVYADIGIHHHGINIVAHGKSRSSLLS